MCRHIYDWNIANCDVKLPIQLNSTKGLSSRLTQTSNSVGTVWLGLQVLEFALHSNLTVFSHFWYWVWHLSHIEKLSQKLFLVAVCEVNWLFNVTINDISVIYVTAHGGAGRLKKKLDLRSGSQRHRHFAGFFNVPVLAPTRDQPFYTVILTHRPI